MEDKFIKLAVQILFAKKWSNNIKVKKHTKDDIFAEGSAHEIAEYLYNTGKSKAMSRLNFYINRAGKNLSDHRKRTLNNAKNILSKKIDKSKN